MGTEFSESLRSCWFITLLFLYMCLCVHAYVYVCMYVCLLAYVCMQVHVEIRGRCSGSSSVIYHLIFWDSFSHRSWSFLVHLDQPSEVQGSICLSPPHPKSQGRGYRFLLPHLVSVCTSCGKPTFSKTEPFLQSPSSSSASCFGFWHFTSEHFFALWFSLYPHRAFGMHRRYFELL